MARSLAATWAITSVFFSCGYLDVSVPRVPSSPKRSDRSLHLPGRPIQKSVDHCALAAPYRVSPLGTSFIGTLPLGIPQKPCLTLNAYPLHTHSLPPPRHPIRKVQKEVQKHNPIGKPQRIRDNAARRRTAVPQYSYRAKIEPARKKRMSEDAVPHCKQKTI